MAKIIFTIVCFFGGITLYIINNLMFKTFKMNNGSKILLFLGALIPASLSPMIVQEDFIEKWDGKLPTYMLGGNGSNVMKVLP